MVSETGHHWHHSSTGRAPVNIHHPLHRAHTFVRPGARPGARSARSARPGARPGARSGPPNDPDGGG